MNIILALNTAFVHPTSGAGRTMMTFMEWLADAGHSCRVLCTARFDGLGPESISAHLDSLSVPVTIRDRTPIPPEIKMPAAHQKQAWPVAEFRTLGIDVTMLCIERKDLQAQTVGEMLQMIVEFDALSSAVKPDLLVTYGGGRAVQSYMQRARRQGTTTLFTLHNRGYADRGIYEHVDNVWSCSAFLRDFYNKRCGLLSTGFPCPVNWAEVTPADPQNQYLTFVNPAPHKGLAIFARLAEMLFERRPDIPLLVVQSAARKHLLQSSLSFEIEKHPNFSVVGPYDDPSQIYQQAKVLLAPSLVPETFGRVAVEAMINGVPPLVGNRGALPETVGGAGRVLPIPHHMDGKAQRLPDTAELEPWFDAIVRFWDDPAYYDAQSSLARREADRLYGEAAARKNLAQYIESLKPNTALFEQPEC
jgi:glycosyltransferase involved in cell wall biosynthesis